MPAKLVAERYELRELLGEGGMGVVYRAIDTRTGGLVAIKTMRDTSDPRTLEMFKKEWRVLARLSHPNIVDIRDVDEIEEDGVRKPCFVMPLLSGMTLAQLIKDSSSRLTVPRLVNIVSQVCNGLEAAHRSDLIHRDLKPSNIFVMEDDTAKIIDFGLVHATGANSFTGYKGTWQYMAPEQTEGKSPTTQSDIFSLGVVAYESLTGRKPFARKSVEATIDAIRTFIPPAISEINPKVSQLLSKVVHKAMAKHPMHRYASAKELAEVLQKACRNEPIERFDATKILPRIERARKAFTRDDCAFASEILTELEAEGNVDPEITLLRAQIEESVKQKRIRQLFEGAQTRLEQDEIPLALDKLREILTLDPENSEALAMRKRIEGQRNNEQISNWMKLARQHADLHDFAEARQAVKEVLNIRYDDSDALNLLSEIDVQEKEAANARAEKEQLYGSALKAYQGGEISSALSKLEKILDVSRRVPGATVPERDAVYQSFYNRVRSERDTIDKGYEDGRKCLNDKDFAKALEICNQMLVSYPGSAQFQALKLKIEQSERQELSSFIAEIARSADGEPNLDRRVGILEEACKRYPQEGQFQQSLRLVREQRDLVHSILSKARQYDEQSQFADAIGQWKILRSIHPQYPGVDFEIAQLEKRREQQSSEEKKGRFVDRIDRAVENGAYAKAVEIAESALTEFPQDPELVVLERIARQGLERIREAERLSEDARKARVQGRFEDAIELLRSALKLDEHNAGICSALVSILVEQAHSLLDEDWRKASALAESAAQIDQHHPAVKRLRTLIADSKRKDAVTQHVADARQLQLSGDVRGALDRLGDALSQYPEDQRLKQFHGSLQNSLSPQKDLRSAQADIVERAPLVERARAAVVGGGEVAADPEGLSAMFQRSDVELNSIAQSRLGGGTPSYTEDKRGGNGTGISSASAPPLTLEPAPKPRGPSLPERINNFRETFRPYADATLARLTSGAIVQPKNMALIGCALAAIVLLSGIGIWFSRQSGRASTGKATTASTASVITVPISLSPSDAVLTLDGKVMPERKLTLDISKKHEVRVSRLGYLTQTRWSLAPDKSGWNFKLDPEPLHIQVITGDRIGKILLDDKEVWNLQQGELTSYELPADGSHHVLTGKSQTGEAFKVAFQALAGVLPQVDPLNTKDLVVGTSLGNQANIFSTAPSSLTLPGQAALPVTPAGSLISLSGVEGDQAMLAISDGKRTQTFALAHGNGPALSVLLSENTNIGSIVIDTPVAGAQLFLDGRERQTLKAGHWRFAHITPGVHELRAIAPGYADETLKVQVEKGKESKPAIDFKIAPAILALTGGTPGAEIVVDGIQGGTLDGNGSARLRISPGSHKIELRRGDFESVVLSRDFTAAQTVEMQGRDITLKALGSLAFDVNPTNAIVTYRLRDDGEAHTGSVSGAVRVRSGTYIVTADASGYKPASSEVIVAAGESGRARLQLQAKPVADTHVIRTRDFVLRVSDVRDEGQWSTGTTNGFLPLRQQSEFTLTFLKPERIPVKHKGKKVEWRVTIYPDSEVDYELDAKQLTRTVKAAGKSQKFTTKIQAWNGDFAVIRLTLQEHGIRVGTAAGPDDFVDNDHTWSHAIISVRGDQFFSVRR